MRSFQRDILRAGSLAALTLIGLAMLPLLAGCAGTAETAAEPVPERPAGPYPVVYAVKAPKIDGKLDDAVWKEAVVLDRLYEYEKVGARIDTVKAQMAWDRRYLYFAVAMRDRDIYVQFKERDEILCRADCAELFLKPSATMGDLYEFEFNVWNAIWDIHYVGSRWGGGSWARFSKFFNPAIRIASTHDGTINNWEDEDKGYVLEIAIPLSAFKRTTPGGPKPGDTWKFNVAGYDFSVYRERFLEITSVDGQTEGYAEHTHFPTMIFMPPK